MKNLLLFFILLPIFASSQSDMEKLLEGTGFSYEYVEDDRLGTIEYIKSSPQSGQKGLIIFSMGSLPMPLYFIDDGYMYPTLPFNPAAFSSDYQFVIISKPGVKIVEYVENLDDNYSAINEEGKFRKAYLDKYYLEYYVASTRKVMDDLLAKRDYEDIVVMGHSQGARVSLEVSIQDERITHLVQLASATDNRFAEEIRAAREAGRTGQKTHEEAQLLIEARYEKWRKIVADPESLDGSQGDSNRTWLSFSENRLPELLALDLPIYLTYGTADISAYVFDILPLYYIKNGNENITMKAHVGYDHSFQKMDQNGKTERIFHQVVAEAIDWIMAN